MTYNEARDKVTELLGYSRCKLDPTGWHGGPNWPKDTCESGCHDGLTTRINGHPIKNKLGAIAKLFQEHLPGWYITVEHDSYGFHYWCAYASLDSERASESVGGKTSEQEARIALFIECWETGRGRYS